MRKRSPEAHPNGNYYARIKGRRINLGRNLQKAKVRLRELEAELASNAWLTCPFDADILFNTASELRLEAAAAKLRVNLSLLTSQAGHA